MKYLLFTLFYINTICLSAQQLWQQTKISPIGVENQLLPADAVILKTDFNKIQRQLINFGDHINNNDSFVLPSGEGTEINVNIRYSPIMGASDAAKFPSIKTFQIWNNELGIYGRMGTSKSGFYAQYTIDNKTYLLRKLTDNPNGNYVIYNYDAYASERSNAHIFNCGTTEDMIAESQKISRDKIQLRTNEKYMQHYRLLISTTAQYAQLYLYDEEKTMEGIVQTVNILNAKYNFDLGMQFDLVDSLPRFFNLSPHKQYFEKTNQGLELLQQNQDFLDSLIHPALYDVAQVFTGACNDVGGVVWGRACNNTDKARGVSCNDGSDYFYTTFKHELGHQFSGGHTFNSCNGSSQFNPHSAFEPGAGSTILSYGSSCGSDNVGDRIDYFHSINIIEISSYAEALASTCGTFDLSSANQPPVIQLAPNQAGVNIPIMTPFELYGTATDANNDPLKYSWEQFDLGTGEPLGTNYESGPLFVVFPPSQSGNYRSFPKADNVLNDNHNIIERLPEVSRDMTFNFIARDANSIAGSTVIKTINFKTTDQAGPFQFTFPAKNTDTILTVGQDFELKWDPANTSGGEVNAPFVNILFSSTNGIFWRDTLIYNTPNDGSETIMIPRSSGKARFKIKPVNNIFYNVTLNPIKIIDANNPGYAFDLKRHELTMCRNTIQSIEINTVKLGNFDQLLFFTALLNNQPNQGLFFSNDKILSGLKNSLIIDTRNISAGEYTVNILVTTLGGDTVNRVLNLTVTAEELAIPDLNTPLNGASEISEDLFLSWNPINNAVGYEVQLFESSLTIYENMVLDTIIPLAGFMPRTILPSNKVYYWRVRTIGECGPGRWSEINIFYSKETFETAAIIRVHEDTLLVKTNSFKHLDSLNLFCETRSLSGELITDTISYQLISLPIHGQLFLDGTPLKLGDQFTNGSVVSKKIYYQATEIDYTGNDLFKIVAISNQHFFKGPMDINIDINEAHSAKVSDQKSIPIHIFPNPASDIIHIMTSEKKPVKVMIADLLGNMMDENSCVPESGNLQISVEQLKPGMYILQIISKDQIYTGKFDKI